MKSAWFKSLVAALSLGSISLLAWAQVSEVQQSSVPTFVQSDVVQGQPVEPEPMRLPVLRYSTDAKGSVVTEAEVAQALARNLPMLSRYGGMREFVIRGMIDRVEMEGVMATAGRSSTMVTYVKGYRDRSRSRPPTLTETRFAVAVRPLSERGTFELAPRLIQEKEGRTLFVFSEPPLAQRDVLWADLQDALNKTWAPVPRTAMDDAEFDVKYPPASVYSNFERKLGRMTNTSIPKSPSDPIEGTYGGSSLMQGIQQVKVQVFPYRDGSKVKTTVSHAYEVRGDGSSTYSLEVVRRQLDQLRRIAND